MSKQLVPNQKKRTQTQNNALHLYFRLISDKLSDAGYTIEMVLKRSPEVSWSPVMVKELLWRPLQRIKLGKKSTTELNSVSDINEVYNELNLFLSQNFGITEPFPSLEELEKYVGTKE